MEYKLTFEDGSEAYLEHYGVKGMKWKNHVKAIEKDLVDVPKRKNPETLATVHELIRSKKFNKKSVKKAKEKVKDHFRQQLAASPGVEARSANAIRKGKKLRGTHAQFVVNKDGSVTSTLAKDRRNW